MNDILHKEFRTYYSKVHLYNNCKDILEYLIQYNQHQKERLKDNSEYLWRYAHKRSFEKSCGNSLQKIKDDRINLNNLIINKIQFLNSIYNLKYEELYIASEEDLNDMKHDLTLITKTLNLINDNIYNLDINKTILKEIKLYKLSD